MSSDKLRQERNSKAKRNIIYSFVLKGLSVAFSMLLIPLSLKYLHKEDFGLWLTISSIVSWLAFFDIGLANGLRNNLAEAIAKKNYQLAKELVSTTYALLMLIVTGFFIIFLGFNQVADWSKILNADPLLAGPLRTVFIIIFGSFCIKLVLDIINTIATADQNSYISNYINMLINAITLLIIYLLDAFSDAKNLVTFSFYYSIVPILVTGITSIFFFTGKYRQLAPSLRCINFTHSKKLLSLGFQFFFIQLIVMIIFSTDNFLITRLFGPKEVPAFNIAFRYLSVVSIGFGIILTPFWSAITEAYVNRDYSWIKKIINKLMLVWGLTVIGVIIMFFISPVVYKYWIGDEVQIPKSVTLWLGVFVLISCWNNIFAYFLNGVSKLRLQLYTSLVIGIINIPMAILLSRVDGLGVTAVAIANCISLFIPGIIIPIQYKKIINNKATGIWNK
ncbi:oligosaccharide flippase family protein [Chitinophaga sp. CB10]|uniref:lipopolysaccharide biosynthesis protein n=1 Tax=Chitinophaga sp. CB10 TaxID=1891659 RepID=UPI0025C3C9C2|nr:oligosaccharide flippase family protein [Chitinophaga sp. CB10]